MNDDTPKQLEPVTGSREIEQFDPKRFRVRDRAYDFTIEEAKRVKKWPALEQAVDDKIEELKKLVAWWKGELTDQGGRPSKTVPRPRDGLSMREAEHLTGMANQRVSDLCKRLADPQKFREHLLGAEYRAAFLEPLDNFRARGTGEDEWYTPAHYIALVRSVLGDIDLDPASSEQANKTVKALEYFDKQRNGLMQPWYGHVFLNSPYSKGLLEKYCHKLCDELNAGRVSEAICLTHAYTSSRWFHQLASVADAFCLTNRRIRFRKPDGTLARPTQGQAFFYFGPNVARFDEVFRPVGLVVPTRFAAIPEPTDGGAAS